MAAVIADQLRTLDMGYRLENSLTAREGRIFLTGTQALVRMLLSQRAADKAAGLNTAGFVTGYRGSPLGGVDMAMWRAQDQLQESAISFLPAINEDMGATMVMGTQQAGMRDDRTVDGVFALWYGKGPGLDRAGDALHHGNAAGASPHGGVLMVVGDDPTAASSSIPHASEASLAAWHIPVINPASVAEYEQFGRWGWALSRYSGAWVALKAVTETVESGRSFPLQPIPDFATPDDDPHKAALPYSAREFLTPAIEQRILQRVQAVRAFARRHRLDMLSCPAPGARMGIVSSGKGFLDTEDALAQLNREADLAGVPLPEIRHYKLGLIWPVEPSGLLDFARGLDHILVVEEKSTIVESQVKDLLFNQAGRPTVCGERGLREQTLLARSGQLTPDCVLAAMLDWLHDTNALPQHSAPALFNETRRRTPARGAGTPAAKLARDTPGPAFAPIDIARKPTPAALSRRPYFCSGCPHNTSTKVPEGSQALAGVGCHYMATWMDRSTSGLTQMGGEGADWIGLSRYIKTPHVFQNMGEGTYFHSGYLAIRQAVAAKANITYKILFNDAVAMTGGQPVDGRISVPGICQQLLGEGVGHVVVTSDDPEKYGPGDLPSGVRAYPRSELDRLQRTLREIPGVTVLIHDQACAAEKRRRRKKRIMPEPTRRLFINEAVCEGCGDCGTQSNCLSLVPVDTPFGRKRAIDQSSCNKDYSCVDGFCPSFVSVEGGRPRKARGKQDPQHLAALAAALPSPATQSEAECCNILVAGIGGTGVITVGAILSMAAHLEGRSASVLDITGLAQKGGAVISHIRLSRDTRQPGAVRIGPQQADTAILCDVVAASRPDALQALRRHGTLVVLNTYLAPTAEFTRDPQANLDPQGLIDQLRATTGADDHAMFDAHGLATSLMGDGILANMMMLGHAWQRGGIPLSEAAIMRALALNGVAVEANKQAFGLGRLAAARPDTLGAVEPKATVIHMPESLTAVMARCEKDLVAYQDAAYAQRYIDTVNTVLAAEQALRPQARPRLALAAARALYKLMAYKDEYEVARLYTDGRFKRKLEETFEGDVTLRFHLAPPLLARRDPATGRPRKMTFGPGMMYLFRLLARCRRVRGSWLDPFAHARERRLERALITDYCNALAAILPGLDEKSFEAAVELAELPLSVRGFGPVKEAAALACQARLRAAARPAHTPRPSVNKVLRAHS